MRTVLVLAAIILLTPFYAGTILVAALLGVKHSDAGGLYHAVPRSWSKWICRAAGARVITHGFEKLDAPTPRVVVANHVSWFDVFGLASVLPRFAFVAKAELGRIPLFGVAAKATGQVFIERANRKAAFAVYEGVAGRIRGGTTVVVFPEGTRGNSYELRPFKKGPFVLAIAAGAPIVPVIIYGSREVHPKGGKSVRPHEIHIHVLDPIETANLTYDDRDALAAKAHDVMAAAFESLYDVRSPASVSR